MSNKSVVTDENGSPTHIRENNDDGTQSRLYEYDNGFWANALDDHKGNCVEIADHHEDGTTTAYEYSSSMWDNFWSNGKGDKK